MQRKFAFASRISGAGVILLALAVLAGWALDAPRPMAVNSAAALLLTASGLVAWSLSPPGRGRVILLLCGALVLSIGAATLSQYLVGWDLHVDRLLYLHSRPDPPPVRMAPLSALNFVLLGLSLLTLRRGGSSAPEVLAGACGVIGLAAVLGHLYGVEQMHRIGTTVSMTPNTGLGFCLMAAAVMLARPDRGVLAMIASDTLTGAIARRVIPIAIVLPAMLGLLRVVGQSQGWYGSAMGTALLATVFSVIFVALLVYILWRLHGVEREADAARDALAQNERRLDVALDAAGLGTWTYTYADGMIEFDERALRLYGVPTSRILHDDALLAAVLHPDDLARTREQVRLASDPSGEGRYHIEYRVPAGGGPTRWIAAWGLVQFEGEGAARRPVRAVGASRDVTEERAAAAALRKSEQQLRAVLEALPVPVFISDASGKLLDSNPAAAALWGGPTPRSEGTHDYGEHYQAWWSTTGERVQSHEWGLARALATGEIVLAEELEVQTLDGRRRTILNYARPILDSAGVIVGGVAVNVDISARKLAEAELERTKLEAERRAAEAEEGRRTLEAIMESIPEGVALTGGPPDFPLLHVSRRGLAMSGHPNPDDLRGSPAGEHQTQWGLRLADGTTLPTREQMPLYRATHLGEETRAMEMVMVRPDGSRVPLLVDAAPIRDRRGRVVAGINCWRDITELKEAERAIRESEERLALAIDGGGFGVWNLDLRTGGAWRSLKHDQIFGYDSLRSQWTFDTFLDHVVPEDRDAVATEFRTAVELQRDWSFECRIRRVDGPLRWIWAHGKHQPGPSGEPHRLFGIVRDITEQKHADEELRRERAFLRQVIDASPSLIFAKDWDGRFVLVNEALAKLYGTTTEDLLGKTDADFNPSAEEVARFLQDDREVMSTQRAKSIAEEPVTSSDGKVRWFSTSKIPLVDPDGACTKVLGVATDISDRKFAEQTLASFNERLAREVDQKTLELRESGERLRRSERMAFIGTLSAGLGHDIGNLLLPIRTRLESIAVDPALPEETRADLVVTQQGLNYLTRLTSGLRTLAVDPEERPGMAAHTDLAAWWDEAAPLLRGVLPRGVALEWTPPLNEVGVCLGTPALTQIVFNLVQNAGDALKGRDAGRVIIWSEPVEGGEKVQLGVRDNGPGMTPEVRERCMEPFFTTKTRQVSTGMGLSLVHGLVQRAGGAIEIASCPGEGATFLVTLPASRRTPRASGPRPRALVSLRNPRIHAFVTSMLESLGFVAGPDPSPESPAMRLWVVEECAHSAGDIAAFIRGDEHRRVVLLNAPDCTPAPPVPDLESPQVLRIRSGFSPPAIRSALHAAAAACALPAANGVGAHADH